MGLKKSIPFLESERIFSFCNGDYLSALLKEYYVLQKYLHVSYTDFMNMPIFIKNSLIDNFMDEIENK